MYRECKFYIKGGKCSHKDAPNPNHSRCIDKNSCGVWEDNISEKVNQEEKDKREG